MSTGNGSAITFGTSGFAQKILRIAIGERMREAIADDDISSADFYEYAPDDLVDPETIEVEYEHDQSAAVQAPIAAAPETITITYKKKTGETTAATLAGSGFVTRASGPTLENGQRPTGSLTIKFDGKTGPTHTAGS